MRVVRPLSAFEAAALGVNPKASKASAIKGRSVAGEAEAPAFEVSDLFTYQSYFSDSLLQRAITAQASNEPIVQSTLSSYQISGYGLALHPSSETPVSVLFQSGAQQGASQAYRLKPGEIIRPHGAVNGQPGSFSGFSWGLPFGWLGGGSAMLVVLRTPDAEISWGTDSPEIIFHRQRMQIYAAAAAPAAASVPLNWPKRFPWPSAQFGASSILQGGQPALAPSPTRTAFRLRMDTLAAPADMRVGFVGSNDFGMNSAGTAVLTDVAFTDMTWGSFTQAGVTAPGTYYPTQMVAGQQDRFACDDGGVILVDISAGQTIATQYVDVVRYGRL